MMLHPMRSGYRRHEIRFETIKSHTNVTLEVIILADGLKQRTGITPTATTRFAIWSSGTGAGPGPVANKRLARCGRALRLESPAMRVAFLQSLGVRLAGWILLISGAVLLVLTEVNRRAVEVSLLTPK